MIHKIIPIILVLTLATLACGFSVNLPSAPTPGPTVTDDIAIAALEANEIRVKLSFGAGELTLAPGADDMLVEGTATYNISDFKPEISTGDGLVEISQGEYRFKTVNLSDIENAWDLKLGDKPIDLTIQAGAYDGNYEFGGLALTNLTIKDGAADVDLSFSEPNRVEMSVLRYETGASNVELINLANANFSTMIFNGGAGDFTLDFNGELERDATVTVDSGFSDLKIVIPEDLNAEISVEGAAVNVNHSSGWGQSNQTYTQEGAGRTLRIIIKMGAGNVTITD